MRAILVTKAVDYYWRFRGHGSGISIKTEIPLMSMILETKVLAYETTQTIGAVEVNKFLQ